MNRRSFLTDTLKAGIAAAFLPSALTYSRHWVRQGPIWVIDGPTTPEQCALPFVYYKVRELRSGYCVGVSSDHAVGKSTLIGIGRFAKANGLLPAFTDNFILRE